MARGPKKHMKRMATPSHWMLDKLTGVWAPRPSAGPHKLRECLPLVVLLRNRLKYALTYKEAKMILMERTIKVDGKVRMDHAYPSGNMDVISIPATKENFRLLYDTKGRFVVHKISDAEAEYKLCQVKRVCKGANGINYMVTHDGRTVRFPDPEIKTHDTVRISIADGKVLDYIKFEHGNVCMLTGGNNIGRVGAFTHREKHPGSHDIIHLKDSRGHSFATRSENVMVIGDKAKAWISLPKGDGIKKNNTEDRAARMAKK